MLVLVDVVRVVEQAADEGGLAVVDAAGGGEAKQVFGARFVRRGSLRSSERSGRIGVE